MKTKLFSLTLLMAAACPSASDAMSLGEISLGSGLDQPLDAHIAVLSADADEAGQLTVRLASQGIFKRAGLARTAALDDLRFTSAVKHGKPVILVSSSQPISEPVLNFFLEVDGPQGSLLKKYSLLLGGPASGGQTKAAPIQVVQAEILPEQPGSLEHYYAPPIRSGKPAKPAASPSSIPAAPPHKYRVRRGDTLFTIAGELKPAQVQLGQMLLALYQNNPRAFVKGDANALKTGVWLKVPDATTASLVAVDKGEQFYNRLRYPASPPAAKFVASAKKPAEPPARHPVNPPKLAKQQQPSAKPVPPLAMQGNSGAAGVMGSDGGVGSARVGGVVADVGLSDLAARLAKVNESLGVTQDENQKLISVIRQKNRLIALRDDQVAALQQQLETKAAPLPQAALDVGQQQTANSGAAMAYPHQMARLEFDGGLEKLNAVLALPLVRHLGSAALLGLLFWWLFVSSANRNVPTAQDEEVGERPDGMGEPAPLLCLPAPAADGEWAVAAFDISEPLAKLNSTREELNDLNARLRNLQGSLANLASHSYAWVDLEPVK